MASHWNEEPVNVLRQGVFFNCEVHLLQGRLSNIIVGEVDCNAPQTNGKLECGLPEGAEMSHA